MMDWQGGQFTHPGFGRIEGGSGPPHDYLSTPLYVAFYAPVNVKIIWNFFMIFLEYLNFRKPEL